MAACMLRLRCQKPMCFASFKQLRNLYICLIPEIPDESPDQNPLLRPAEVPKFQDVTIENCINSIGKLVTDFEGGLSRLEDSLPDKEAKNSFDSIIEPIERLSFPLTCAWSNVKTYATVKHSDRMTNVYQTLHPRVQKARSARFHSLPIYKALKDVKSANPNLTEEQLRIVDKYLLEGRLNGIELSGYNRSHFWNVVTKLAEQKHFYRMKLEEATKRFRHIIEQPDLVRNFPDSLVRALAQDPTNPTKGPWKVTLQPNIYMPFLEYCDNRDLRWNAWFAYNSRCSSKGDTQLNNSVHMEEIRFQRRDEAKLLGYNTYVDISMETKMAGNVENVLSMIESLKVKSKPIMEKELAELSEFAAERGFEGKLQLWDIPYWRRKQRHTFYSINEDEVRNYFQLPTVLSGLFKLCKLLFGITIKGSHRDSWHETVQYFDVYDKSNSHIASFYLDPYARPGKLPHLTAVETGCGKCSELGILPVVYLIFNFAPPMYGKPSLLYFDEVVTLFKKFGQALQNLLTTVENCEISSLSNIEWDVVDVCPNFMSMWLLHPDVAITHVSKHHETGNQIPRELYKKLCQSRNHMKSFDLIQQLYLSALDVELYSNKDFWLEIVRKVWPEYYVDFPLDKCVGHPCSFKEIFSEDYAAAYYSSTWSQMIAADIFGAFKEVNWKEPEELTAVGMRFRDTFLSLGGGCRPSEMFRRFRGRDPSPDALLELYDLK